MIIFIEFLSSVGHNAYVFVGKIKTMGKRLATLKALVDGGASIESVGKSPITRTPGDLTQIGHN
jgi:hypothetical protein